MKAQNMNNLQLQANIFWQLLIVDLKTFVSGIRGRLINIFIATASAIIINSYIMPHLGLAKNYGSFFVVGAGLVSVAFFDACFYCEMFISDLESDKEITYELILPMPSWLVLCRKALVFACYSAITAITILPLSKLLLWNILDLSHFSLFHFVIGYVTICMFFGFFSLLLASCVSTLAHIADIWLRYILPLWHFGCIQYAWSVTWEVSPWFAYASLLNPLVYCTEGMRAAILGPTDSLPFWICMPILWLFSIVFGLWAIKRWQYRLDCV